MKTTLLNSVLALALFVGFSAHAQDTAPTRGDQSPAAGLFVEPGITLEWGDSRVNYPAPLGGTDGSINGLGLMTRLGFHINDMIFLTADGRYSRPTVKTDSNSYDSTANAYNWGLTGGVQMPLVGLRAWAGWIAGGMVDPGTTNNLDVKFTGASGWRLGAGLKFILVSVNLEYQYVNYTNTEIQAIGPFATSAVFSNTNLENKSWILSVSMPLAI